MPVWQVYKSSWSENTLVPHTTEITQIASDLSDYFHCNKIQDELSASEFGTSYSLMTAILLLIVPN
jgi:hypothetical protein